MVVSNCIGHTRPPNTYCSNRLPTSGPKIQPTKKSSTPAQTGHTGNRAYRSTRIVRCGEGWWRFFRRCCRSSRACCKIVSAVSGTAVDREEEDDDDECSVLRLLLLLRLAALVFPLKVVARMTVAGGTAVR